MTSINPGPEAADDLSRRLAACYSGAVYDVLRERGRPLQVLPSGLRPLEIGTTLAGPVFTLSGGILEGADPHETVLAWTGFLSAAPRGAVVICQPEDDSLAHMGELSAETLHARGVRGYIVDGGCRDTGFITRLGFPVFCRYTTPRDIVGRWMTRDLGAPIEIGGVAIATGDYVIADRDGIVIIPEAIAPEVIAEAEEVLKTEDKVRAAILAGVDPREAYLRYGKF